MKDQIIASLKRRVEEEISSRNKMKIFKELEWEKHYDKIIEVMYLYTRPKRGSDDPLFFVEIIMAVGRAVADPFFEEKGIKKDSSMCAKLGAFIVYTFEELQLLYVSLGAGRSGHQSFVVTVVNDDAIQKLWEGIDSEGLTKLPSTKPYADWEGFIHTETGTRFIKTKNKAVKKWATPSNMPIMFESVNRAQRVGWRINREVYDLQMWCFQTRAPAFNDIWKAHSREAMATKKREIKAINSIATMFLDREFYHLYYLDFRGRRYCSTAYLNEQGSDLAKGLILRAKGKPLTERGFYWLCVSIASNWANDAGREDGEKTDKIPPDDRYQWVLDNEDMILQWGASPKVYPGWMNGDKPWQLISNCMEFRRIREIQAVKGKDYYDMPTQVVVYIDGSNNGSQHLSALTLDEVTAPHVNLVPSEMPGDLYRYVGQNLWERLMNLRESMSEKAIKSGEQCIHILTDLKARTDLADPRSPERKILAEDISRYRSKYKEIIKRAAPLYWLRIEDLKDRRKLVKRGTMTLPYGAKPYGLGQQIIVDSRKHGIEILSLMEHSWGAFLGRLLFDVCGECLKRPMRLLSTFADAGQAAEDRGDFLHWTTPITNFLVVQHYVEGSVKKIWVQYGPPVGERLSTGYYKNTLQIKVAHPELPEKAKRKQAQGAAPNIIHSLDAAHLAMTCVACDFDVTTIHDSFGCLPGDMDDLFRIVREEFVRLYSHDVLGHILADIGMEVDFDKGTLNIKDVLKSDYAFI